MSSEQRSNLHVAPSTASRSNDLARAEKELEAEAAVRNDLAKQRGIELGLFGHGFLALLTGISASLLCGGLGFIPCLWISYRYYSAEEDVVAIMYGIAAIISLFGGVFTAMAIGGDLHLF